MALAVFSYKVTYKGYNLFYNECLNLKYFSISAEEDVFENIFVKHCI